MDSLHRDDIDRARRTTYAMRAAQAFEAMRLGIRLRRAALRARHPEASETEVEDRLRSWLARDD